MIHIGTFPSPWTVAPDDFHYKDAKGREFAITCHTTPGMGSEVVALVKSGGSWKFGKYLDDYVDASFTAQGADMTKYLTWLAGKLTAWLGETFPADWKAPDDKPGDPGVGEPIERIHACLGLLKITANADGTLSASL